MKRQSLKTKIVLLAACCLLLTGSMVVIYSAHFLQKRAMNDAKEQLLAIARAQAANIQAEMAVALNTSHTLSQILSEVKNSDNPLDLQRYEAIDLLRGILMENPKFSGIFTCWDKKAYDYLDSGFADEEGHDSSGRFAPYWHRNEQGKMTLSPLLISPYHSIAGEPGIWYEMSRKSHHNQVQGPIIVTNENGKNHLIAVTVSPIIPEGQFVGVVGIDIDLTFLQAMADNMNIFNNQGKMAVIGYNGTIAAFTGNPDSLGQHIEQIYGDTEDLQKRIKLAEEIVEIRDGQLHAFTSFQIDQSDRPWQVAVVVPINRVVAAPISLMWKQIILFAAITVVVLIAAFFGALSLTKPLSTLVDGMKSIKDGDFSKELIVRSHDEEIDEVVTVFNLMRIKLDETLHELQEHQEKLEEKVSMRTFQLKGKNKELEVAMEAIKDAQEQLLQNEKLAVVGQMSGIVAHEVLNPVAAVSIRIESNIEQANRSLEVIDKLNTLLAKLEKELQNAAEQIGKEKPTLLKDFPMLFKIGTSLRMNQQARLEDFYFLDKQINRVVRIIDNLRQMSKSRQHIEPIHLDKMINEVLDDMGDGLRKRKIQVLPNISSVPPLQADHSEIYSIVSNLVRNAVQSLEKQDRVPEKRLLIHLARRSDNFLELVIQDNGIGIEPEHRNSIFEPGFTSKGRTGTGLGLSFSRKVARSYHGDLVLLNQKYGEGAAFQVLLPLNQEQKEFKFSESMASS
ncbi:MAG: GHKL domain-containing protein [Desulfobulbaceae bacterium]|nr:GHKL domain-containing protein [Desulfobulbaceae bacterium]